MAASEAIVYDAIRTPRGKGKSNGSLHSTKPVDLVVGLMHEMLSRNVELDPARVDDVVLGCVSPVGDQGADIAKTAAIKAGLFTLSVIGVLTSVVGAFYYLNIIKVMYFDEPLAELDPMRGELRTVLAIAGLFNIFFFIYPAPLVSVATVAAKSLF